MGENPYLKEFQRFGQVRVIFAVDEAAAGAQDLYLAGVYRPAAAQTFLVSKSAFQRYCDYLYVVVGVWCVTCAVRHRVVVYNPNRAEVYTVAVEIVREAECVA